MIAVLVCDRDDAERALLNQDCRKQIAENSGEDLRMETVSDDEGLTRAANAEQLVNLLYYRFFKGQSLQALRLFRKRCGDAMVMLITDSAVSPLEYLRPGIAPDALLLRPLEEQRLSEINHEFVSSFLERFHPSEERFMVDTRDEKILIPWSHIYYFEARDKKLFVRTRHEEYAFYDTLEKLESRLPDVFQRCHRSYIVNTAKIVRVISAENYLELADGIGAPLSRSYRARFRDPQRMPGEPS
ncbi:MAG: LytTR family transcriptional regulator DNA-binding domain-containing protein [Oscillibacter sp.]|nr:LytTR family transcriptional regulator DNA-binding domain-containing protein [Oscillibacter sp.]